MRHWCGIMAHLHGNRQDMTRLHYTTLLSICSFLFLKLILYLFFSFIPFLVVLRWFSHVGFSTLATGRRFKWASDVPPVHELAATVVRCTNWPHRFCFPAKYGQHGEFALIHHDSPYWWFICI